MNIKTKILFFLTMSVSVPMLAQQQQTTWTLDECIDYAIEHNLELNNQRYNLESGKESHRQAKRNMLPDVNGSASYSNRYGRSIDPNNNEYINTEFFSNSYSLSASLDIFQGFQKQNAIKATKFLSQAIQEETLQQKYMLAYRVLSAFYNIRYYEGLLEITKEQLSISETNHKYVEKQIELGLKANADFYESKSGLLSDQLAVTQSENDLIAAKLLLIQEMNLPGVDDIQLRTSMEEITKREGLDDRSVDSIYTNAKTFLPNIRSGELSVHAAEKQVAIAKGRLAPSLSFSAGYGSGFYETNVDPVTQEIIPFKNQIRDNASGSIGIYMNIPISNKWAGRSQITQQKIALKQAENNLELKKQELYKIIQQLVQEHNALTSELGQSKAKVEAQRLAFAVVQKKYEKEMISIVELYQARNFFITAQNELLQVEIRLKVNESTLAFYYGLPVFNFVNNR